MNGTRVELVWIKGNVLARIHPEAVQPTTPAETRRLRRALRGARFLITTFCRLCY
jgi:hypothetical protein